VSAIAFCKLLPLWSVEVGSWECSWGERGRSGQMWCVVAAFTEEVAIWGGASCVSATVFRKLMLLWRVENGSLGYMVG